MENKPKMYAINLDDETNKALNDLARQSFRNRSAQIQFLIMQEVERQRAAINAQPSVASEWVKEQE